MSRTTLRVFRRSIAIIALFAFSTCLGGCLGSDEPDTTEADPTYASIKENILEPKCLGCHGQDHAHDGIRLDTYEAILDSNILEAGNSGDSVLYQSVKNGEMPEDAPALSSDAIAAIRDWIDAGAEEN